MGARRLHMEIEWDLSELSATIARLNGAIKKRWKEYELWERSNRNEKLVY